jgi:hypothetical protein
MMTQTAGTAVTNTVERKHGGMPEWAVLGVGRNHEGRLVAYWPYTSDIDGQRFLTRFMVLRTPLASVEITRIHMDDGARSFPHDHSRTFASWKLGRYAEDVYGDPADLTARRHRRHRRFSMALLRHTQAHSITWVSPKLVTVTFLGPKRGKSSYWTPDGFQSIGMGVDQEEWA